MAPASAQGGRQTRRAAWVGALCCNGECDSEKCLHGRLPPGGLSAAAAPALPCRDQAVREDDREGGTQVPRIARRFDSRMLIAGRPFGRSPTVKTDSETEWQRINIISRHEIINW
jgi:hypothetical protein